ncbi:histidine phosphatase family protein [Yoonia sp.]|uniref:histidine phosphatase family protein n=1 Tax=Yoonia sp. TaxID=2212373 RepID=UPI0025F679AA|nr:histidine phosphatase family protein [Yoonia sp.]
MAFPELYILRHGETYWNAENRMQGGLNSPLTQTGKTQAARQAALLSGCDLQGFSAICSPQGRAIETAGIAVACHVPMIRTDDRLREIGVGTWQGRIRDGLMLTARDHDDGPDGPIGFYEHAPGGEGFAALELRCRDFLDGLTGPAVLITHGITSRMLRTIVMGLGRPELGKLPGGQGNVFHLKDGVQKQLS